MRSLRLGGVACALLICTSAMGAQTLRPLTIDDIIALQGIQSSSVTISPDGELVALVVKRPGGPVFLDFDEDSDIWIVSRRGSPPRNITLSRGSDTRWWQAVWSPDGSRLAILSSTRTNNDVTLYVWTAHSGSLTRVSDRNVDTHVTTTSVAPLSSPPMVWIDSVTLVFPVLPVGMYAGMQDERLQYLGPREWAKAAAGVESSVSVVESGRATSTRELPQDQLLRCDVRSTRCAVLAQGKFRSLLPNSLGTQALLIEDLGRIPPVPGKRLLYLSHFNSNWRSRAGIVRLDSAAPVKWIDGIRDPTIPEDFFPHSWSPDGTMLAIVGKGDSTDAYASTLFLASATTGEARVVSDRSWEVARTMWLHQNTLLTQARRTGFAPPGTDTDRVDWWASDPRSADGPESGIRITSHLADVPSEFVPVPDSDEILGVADGRLIRIDVRDGRALGENATAPTGDTLSGFVWPAGALAVDPAPHDVYVETVHHAIYRIAIAEGGSVDPLVIPTPSPDAQLVAVDAKHHMTVFMGVERTGTFLWCGADTSSHFVTALTLNQQVRNIADVKPKLIRYIGADGDSLAGLLVVPPGYVPGRRYPLITFVYGGDSLVDTTTYGYGRLFDKQSVHPLNLALFAAHGYAVLIPSAPMGPEDGIGDPMIEVSKGVLGAVDEAIRLGIADPQRIGVIGQSFGGYNVFSLIAYTRRFQAAVSLAGFADLGSLYGEFDPRARYTEFPLETQFAPFLAESGQNRMGVPPWDNFWRYIRNSPLFFVDRIDTPVMIVKGDLDGIPMSQAEQIFTALYRMGRPAKLVRYWGEGHFIYHSPANVRDLWHRLFDWFDGQFKMERQPRQLGNF